MTTEAEYQPRYLAYCRVHGMAPDAMLAHDRERWPGGLMCGFIIWINARWRDWDRSVGRKDGHNHTTQEHVAFDAWLDNYEEPAA